MSIMLSVTASARHAFEERLAALLSERALAMADSVQPRGSGDVVDRTGNVQALILLAELDRHIAEIRLQLQSPRSESDLPEPDGLALGDRVTLRFGEDETAETFLVGFVEQARPGLDVVTLGSPLGRALLGARHGDLVQYQAAGGGSIKARVLDIQSGGWAASGRSKIRASRNAAEPFGLSS
jgi:transcription elongation factor GreA